MDIGPRQRRSAAAWGVSLIIGCAGFQPGTPAFTDPRASPGDAPRLVALITDPAADRTARVSAVRRLLETSDPGAIDLLASTLADPETDGAAKVLILDGISTAPNPPEPLFAPVSALARSAGNEDLPLIAPALGAFRTRDSARLLLDLAARPRPDSVRKAIVAALTRLSGRDDLGAGAAEWTDWFDSVAFLSESDWQAALAVSHARRAERLARDLEATREELTSIYRRLYGQLRTEDRPGLLALLLADPREEVRTLGFQLAALELSAGGALPQVVSDAALSLLSDPAASTRARAAVLLDQIATPESSSAILDALNRESDPDAAAALLAASARWPSPIGRAAILRWLEQEDRTRPSAAKAALALFRAGLLTDPADRLRAAEALRAVEISALGTPELRLLVAIGLDADRTRVAALLESPSPATRLAAAGALAGRREFLPQLLDAAALDANLFTVTADSIVAMAPSATDFRSLAALSGPDEKTRTEGLLAVAARLAPADLLEVAEGTADPQFAARLLDSLPQLVADADSETAGTVARAIGLLVRKRLELGQPDRALAGLELYDTLRSNFPSLPAGEAADLRVVAYLGLDRVDRALAVGGSPEAWLQGLELSTEHAHARSIVTHLRNKFQGRLTPDQAIKLALLEERLAEVEEREQRRLVGPPAPPEPR